MGWLKNLLTMKETPQVKYKVAPERPRPEKTIVLCRYINRGGGVQSKYWESEVFYDSWGAPMIYGDGYKGYDRGTKNVLEPRGQIGDHPWRSEWKHKSGPPVKFNLGDTTKTWYPPNPNDDIPLN